jgi:hypothetical protein
MFNAMLFVAAVTCTAIIFVILNNTVLREKDEERELEEKA